MRRTRLAPHFSFQPPPAPHLLDKLNPFWSASDSHLFTHVRTHAHSHTHAQIHLCSQRFSSTGVVRGAWVAAVYLFKVTELWNGLFWKGWNLFYVSVILCKDLNEHVLYSPQAYSILFEMSYNMSPWKYISTKNKFKNKSLCKKSNCTNSAKYYKWLVHTNIQQ